jgi:hypothetical protein
MIWWSISWYCEKERARNRNSAFRRPEAGIQQLCPSRKGLPSKAVTMQNEPHAKVAKVATKAVKGCFWSQLSLSPLGAFFW